MRELWINDLDIPVGTLKKFNESKLENKLKGSDISSILGIHASELMPGPSCDVRSEECIEVHRDVQFRTMDSPQLLKSLGLTIGLPRLEAEWKKQKTKIYKPL